MKTNIAVVVPNWNGKDIVGDCLMSLQSQSSECSVIVVDNGSTDGSVKFIKSNFPEVELIELPDNHGFAGGVNAGIRQALTKGAEYVTLLNSDAVADKDWLKHLYETAKTHSKFGIITSKILRGDKEHIDSTGDFYSIWGLPFPRGRNEIDDNQYDNRQIIFAGSGGASLYRSEMLQKVGKFDEDFFAYFEDVDLSFRAQLAGWKVRYEPRAVVYHQIGGTSSKLGNFTHYHSVKNFMLLYAKNMPKKLYWKYLPLFCMQLLRWFLTSLLKGKIIPFIKGVLSAVLQHRKTLKKRKEIQSSRKVSVKYIDSMLYHHRPPRPPNLENR